MTYTTNDRDAILCAVNLEDLLEELGERRGLTRRGHAFPCPNVEHEQSGGTPPVTVSLDPGGWGVWKCHACTEGGSAIDALVVTGLTVAEAFTQLDPRRPEASVRPAQRPADTGPVAAPPDPDGIPEAILARLLAVKGWSEPTLQRLGIGWNGQRVVIPIADVEGRKGMVNYLPNADVHGKTKMIAGKGTQRQLFPAPESLEGEEAWVVEGEPDSISGHELGLPATGVPGVDGWKQVWAARFAHFKRVIVVSDCDEVGRRLARKVAADIAALGPEVRRLDLDPKRTDKYDIGDALVENLADRTDFAQLLRQMALGAPVVSPHEAAYEQMAIRAEAAGLPLTLRDAADMIAEADATVPAVWGEHPHVLWSKGETFMIAGATGAGKTTLAQQILLRRIGVIMEPLMDMEVEVSERPIMYLSLDRDKQAQRSMRRMVERLPRGRLMWHADLGGYRPTAEEPARFVEWLLMHGIGTCMLDSLYAIIGSAKDEARLEWYKTLTRELAEAEIEFLVLHHFRKGSGEEGASLIDQVYGGAQIGWSAGSILALSGEPGDEEVEAYHVKQPAKPCGPWTLKHDHEHGITSAEKHPSVLELLKAIGEGTAKDISEGCKRTGRNTRRTEGELQILIKSGDVIKDGEEYRLVGNGALPTPDDRIESGTDDDLGKWGFR
jgi:hypothetical protein